MVPGPTGTPVRRLAVAVAVEQVAAPPTVNEADFRRACLADTYEVLAGLAGVAAGVAGLPAEEAGELLWPEDRAWPSTTPYDLAVVAAGAGFDQLVVVAGDAPDLPGLVLAKMFRALGRAAACVAPDRVQPGCVAFGVRLPWPAWLPVAVSLDDPLDTELAPLAPDRRALAVTPDWHRLRTPAALARLDPGLEGWEETRLLLT